MRPSKVKTYQVYICCFPPTICLLACGSRCATSKFSNFFLVFNTPYSKKKDSHISNICDICLLARSQLPISEQDKPKWIWTQKRGHVSHLLKAQSLSPPPPPLWVCLSNDYTRQQHNMECLKELKMSQQIIFKFHFNRVIRKIRKSQHKHPQFGHHTNGEIKKKNLQKSVLAFNWEWSSENHQFWYY